MTFKEYLITKKIDPKKFEESEKDRFDEWRELFAQLHPKSFTDQKLFLLNKMRRLYLLTENMIDTPAKPKSRAKPVIKPKLNK
jgi:hypothetical protein